MRGLRGWELFWSSTRSLWKVRAGPQAFSEAIFAHGLSPRRQIATPCSCLATRAPASYHQASAQLCAGWSSLPKISLGLQFMSLHIRRSANNQLSITFLFHFLCMPAPRSSTSKATSKKRMLRDPHGLQGNQVAALRIRA